MIVWFNGWLVGWLVGKFFELRGQKQTTHLLQLGPFPYRYYTLLPNRGGVLQGQKCLTFWCPYTSTGKSGQIHKHTVKHIMVPVIVQTMVLLPVLHKHIVKHAVLDPRQSLTPILACHWSKRKQIKRKSNSRTIHIHSIQVFQRPLEMRRSPRVAKSKRSGSFIG